MNLTAIVPVWNGRDLLARLLTTLERQTLKPSELLVIDNGSTDGAPELARQRGGRVIAMGHNAGFAAAVNRGIRESREQSVAILNSDVELAPDYLDKLAAAGAAFATGKILQASRPELIDGTFDAVCRGGAAWRVGQGRPDGPAFAARHQIEMAPWTAVLYRTEVFTRVGLLNEAFESYLEDVEFGMRCASCHIRGLYVPEAVAWHLGSGTLGRWHPDTVRRLARNQCYLVAAHYPAALLLRHAWAIVVAQTLWGCVAARHGASWAWVCGKIQGMVGARRVRRQAAPAQLVTNDWLHATERMIYDIQQATGFDWFWRLYFLLTGSK